MLLPEYQKLYNEYKNRPQSSSELAELSTLTKKIPSIITYCKNHRMEKRFKYNHWIDTTDLVDIDSKIDSSLYSLVIMLKVKFSDLETEQAYKEHVEQFSREIRERFPNDRPITTSMKLRIGSIENEKLFERLNNVHLLQNLHWSIRIFVWFANVYGRTIINVEKVVSVKLITI